MRTCKTCNIEQPMTEYYVRSRTDTKVYYTHVCKKCCKVQNAKKWQSKTLAQRKEHNRKNRERYSSDERKDIRLKARYGITLNEFNEMIETQNNKCKICSVELTHGPVHTSNARLDHCHDTQKVRGILCHNCNSLLGHAKDNATILKNAIRYLHDKV